MNDLFNILASEMDAEQEEKSGYRACVVASNRVNRRYASWLHKAESEGELEGRLDLIDNGLQQIAEDASAEEGYDDPEAVRELVREGMLKGSPYPENSEENAPDHSPEGHHWPKKVNDIYNACMREHSDYGKEKCAKIAWSKSGEDHEAAVHEADGPTPSDGDSYEKERVSPEQGAGASPTINKSRVPEDGLEPVDVPSKAHPREHQDLLQPRDFGKSYQPDPTKAPRKQVDPDEPIGNQKGDRTKTYPKGQQAAPVTSKWHVADGTK